MNKEENLYSENFTVEIDLFEQQVMFHFGDIELLKEQLAKYFEEHQYKGILEDIKSKEGVSLGTTYSMPKGTLVYMPNRPETDRDYGVLAHEILHVVFRIMEKVGIEYSPEGEETYTYLMQALMQSALEALHEENVATSEESCGAQ